MDEDEKARHKTLSPNSACSDLFLCSEEPLNLIWHYCHHKLYHAESRMSLSLAGNKRTEIPAQVEAEFVVTIMVPDNCSFSPWQYNYEFMRKEERKTQGYGGHDLTVYIWHSVVSINLGFIGLIQTLRKRGKLFVNSFFKAATCPKLALKFGSVNTEKLNPLNEEFYNQTRQRLSCLWQLKTRFFQT